MIDVPVAIPGLDYDFLRYIGATTEGQQRIQSYYLPLFEGCKTVVDLGCGDGDFIILLLEQGIEAIGVDSDEKAFRAAKEKNLPIVFQDVVTYLREMPDNSVDGIFSAHLVEHLPYQIVLELIQQSYRVLRPSGRLLLATPDPRTLFSHLEMFYLHYGHVSFYHPRLLSFFLEYTRFSHVTMGVNPNTASILLPELRSVREQLATLQSQIEENDRYLKEVGAVSYNPRIPIQGSGLIHHMSYCFKRWFTRMFVQPLTDDLVEKLNQSHQWQTARLTQQQQSLVKQMRALTDSLDSLNGPFECYATGTKNE